MPKRKKARKGLPTVVLKRNTYQPTKAELEEEVRIPTTPEQLAKAALRNVNIEYED